MKFINFLKNSAMDPFFYLHILLASFFIYLLFTSVIKDRKNNSLKKNGYKTSAEVISLKSNNGENSGFVNVTIELSFFSKENKKIISEVRTTIDVTTIDDYKPGKIIPVVYSEKENKVFLDKPNVLMKRFRNIGS